MSWRAHLLIIVLALGAGLGGFFLGSWWFGPKPAPGSAGVGDPAPAFELPDLQGRPLRLADYSGKVVLINFWAVWCPPCREEIPLLMAARKRFGAQGFEVIGVALDTPETVRDFAQEIGIDYPNVLVEPTDFSLPRAFGSSREALPYSAIVGRDGRIHSVKLGEYREAELMRAVEAALGE